jgi:hypothetical protein
VIKLSKFILVLMDQPDTIKRIEGNISHSIEDKLHQLSDDDLRALAASDKELPPYVDCEVIPNG